jgi:hypothetical protein
MGRASLCLGWWAAVCGLPLAVAARASADASAGPASTGSSAGADAVPPPASSAPSPTKAPPTVFIGAPAGYRRVTTWDLNLEGALGSTLGSGHALTGFGRARAGVLALRDANVFALGLTYEYSNLQHATFGLQGEYINDDSGFWAQLGALLDGRPRPGGMLALGYTLVGAELQLRSYEATGLTFAAYLKLRIPIGFIAAELR